MAINGYNNCFLKIDLSSGRISRHHLSDNLLKEGLGGRGLGVVYLSRNLSPAVNPLGEEATLVFAPGGLVGSAAPTSGRFSITFKSPLTGTICSSNSGGFWGNTFKRTGYDMLCVKGKAAVPVYIYISDKKADIIECPKLWGNTIAELTVKLIEKYPGSRVLGIGPAGEKKVLISSIMNDLSRTCGRGGGGAVMGSKNLKAVVVEGSKKFLPENPQKYKTGLYQANKLLRSLPVTAKAFTLLGTSGLLKLVYQHDMLAHRNFQDVQHKEENIEKISGESLNKILCASPRGCFNCRIRCARATRVNRKKGEGPEFETLAMMGANIDHYKLKEIALANYLCNDFGLDTISFGNTLGLAMELFEKGVITENNTGGLQLSFGKIQNLPEIVRLTCLREGFGDLLADGSLRLGRKWGMEELSMTVKGLELPAYDPRSTLMQALGYATSTRGGCHLKGGYMISLGFFGGAREVDRFMVDTVADHVVDEQDSGCIADMLGICRFAFFSFNENELSRIYSGYAGIDLSPHELKKKAKEIINLERRFNLEAGISPQEDTLPNRFFCEKIMISGEKRAIDRNIQFNHMLRKYYEIRGWDI